MKQAALIIILLALISTSPTLAQNASQQHMNRSRISVMSKAGAPAARPSVPVRYVRLPEGARRGYNYYYGRYGRSYSGGYAPSASVNNRNSRSSIPGLVTRPRSSYSNSNRSRR